MSASAPRPYRAILIAGPTASGKSALASHLAARLGGVIVNADSMQVYDGLRLITARPSAAEEAGLPHRLYGHVPPDQTYSTGAWLRDVAALVNDAAAGPLIIVGGTGLYFNALTRGLADMPTIPAAIRDRLRAHVAADGVAEAYAALAAIDPETAARLEPTDTQRIVRALEVMTATGVPISQWQRAAAAPLLAPGADVAAFVLDPPREVVAERIATRFDAMIEAGALEEVASLLRLGLPTQHPVMKAIGVPELSAVLTGTMEMREAVTRAVVASRQYAKRQRTWFRGQMGPEWIRLADCDSAAAFSALWKNITERL